MAYYTSDKRMLKRYRHCRGCYMGFGPAGRTPARLRVSSFISGRTGCPKFWVMLTSVKSKAESGGKW